ncbi:MAG: PfkB family carbohydrate kinase [Propionibacterium sp.]|nr:PfkB family carbohydrate kinase [Propionibacterium sp.]
MPVDCGVPVVCVGLTTLDVVQRVDGPLVRGVKSVSSTVELAAGGPAANAAVACAALGVRVALVTAIGSGAPAAVVRDDLVRQGVLIADCADDTWQVPVASVLVEVDGTRTVVSPGARASDVRPTREALALLGSAAVVLIDGHHPALAEAALAGDAVVVLDAGSPKPHAEAWLPRVDVLAASADYADGLGLSPGEVIDHGLRAGCRAVVVTQGAGDALWADEHGRGRLAPPPVEAVDTNGAGDAFHGALVARLVRGDGLRDAVARAVEVASLRVSVAGARGWMAGLGRSAGPGSNEAAPSVPSVSVAGIARNSTRSSGHVMGLPGGQVSR